MIEAQNEHPDAQAYPVNIVTFWYQGEAYKHFYLGDVEYSAQHSIWTYVKGGHRVPIETQQKLEKMFLRERKLQRIMYAKHPN